LRKRRLIVACCRRCRPSAIPRQNQLCWPFPCVSLTACLRSFKVVLICRGELRNNKCIAFSVAFLEQRILSMPWNSWFQWTKSRCHNPASGGSRRWPYGSHRAVCLQCSIFHNAGQWVSCANISYREREGLQNRTALVDAMRRESASGMYIKNTHNDCQARFLLRHTYLFSSDGPSGEAFEVNSCTLHNDPRGNAGRGPASARRK
jgi:hypothetical protein